MRVRNTSNPSLDSQQIGKVGKALRAKDAAALCTSLAMILPKSVTMEEWNAATPSKLISPSATADAADVVLHGVLGGLIGTDAVKKCGLLIYGGAVEGVSIIPEPLLEEDVLWDMEKSLALVTIKYTLVATSVKRAPAFSQTKVERGMEALEKSLFDAANEDEKLALTFAMSSGSGKKKKSKLRSAKGGHSRGKVKKKKEKKKKKKEKKTLSDAMGGLLTTFIKASRYVRFSGADQIPPAAAVTLTALFLQARDGDCPRNDAAS